MSSTSLKPAVTAHLRRAGDFVLSSDLLKSLQEVYTDLDRRTLNQVLYALSREKIIEKQAEDNGTRPRWKLNSTLDIEAYKKQLQEIIAAAQEELSALEDDPFE